MEMYPRDSCVELLELRAHDVMLLIQVFKSQLLNRLTTVHKITTEWIFENLYLLVELKLSQHAFDVLVCFFCAHYSKAVILALILLDQVCEQQPPLMLRF